MKHLFNNELLKACVYLTTPFYLHSYVQKKMGFSNICALNV